MEKGGLTLTIKKAKIMASSPITSWQREGGKVEVVTDFIFLSSKNQCGWWLQLPSTMILESKKKKSVTDFTFPPSICHEVMGLDAMILAGFVLFLFLFFNPEL